MVPYCGTHRVVSAHLKISLTQLSRNKASVLRIHKTQEIQVYIFDCRIETLTIQLICRNCIESFQSICLICIVVFQVPI